jgi:predicted Rossmann fold nucleotide-binding protein DprA/Smf involved in DNA uptake
MLIDHPIQVIERNSQSYPNILVKHLGKDAPERLWAIGCLDLISFPKTAFFCSKSCPGDAILKAMDQAQRWRDEGRCIISGFHSPIEKECLQILLRGRQPIIICAARSIENMRIHKVWRTEIDKKRLLLLSLFPAVERRMTATLAEQRNQMVAALADEVFFAHIAPKGRTTRLSKQIKKWGVPIEGIKVAF